MSAEGRVFFDSYFLKVGSGERRGDRRREREGRSSG